MTNAIAASSGSTVLDWEHELTSASEQDEQAALASILIDPCKYDEVAEIIQPAMFRWPDHGTIFRAIADLSRRGLPVDAVTVGSRAAELADDPDRRYWHNLTDKLYRDIVGHAQHAVYHAREIRSHWTRRKLQADALDLARGAIHPGTDVDDLLQSAAGKLQALIEHQIDAAAVPLNEALADTLALLEADEPPGIPTGFRGIDQQLGGLKPGNLYILAARPAQGKTALALNTSENIAATGTVLLFSLEMSRAELVQRLLSRRLDIPTNRLRSLARGTTEQQEQLLDAVNSLSQTKLLIDDRPHRSVAEMLAQCRIARRKGPLKLVTVDYLGLCKPSDSRAVREVQVSQLAHDLKAMAKQIDAPVLLLCQMNRQVENREEKRPRLSDLRESGGIEAAADVVMFPWREDPKNNPEAVNLFIAKHRAGACGDIPLVWSGPTTTFSDPTPPPRDEWGLPGVVT